MFRTLHTVEDFSWVAWCEVLVTTPMSKRALANFSVSRAVSGSVAGIQLARQLPECEPAFLTQLSLVLNCDKVVVSYLDSKAPTKAILTMKGC